MRSPEAKAQGEKNGETWTESLVTPLWRFCREGWTTKEPEKAHPEEKQKDPKHVITWTKDKDSKVPCSEQRLKAFKRSSKKRMEEFSLEFIFDIFWEVFQSFDESTSHIRWMRSKYAVLVSYLKKEKGAFQKKGNCESYKEWFKELIQERDW